MGTMGIVIIFAPAVGPTFAGWVVQNYTWRILFYVMIPLGIIVILLAFKWLKDVSKRSNPIFDFYGAIFSTIGFGALLYGFSQAGSKGWSSMEVIIFLIVGVLFILLFVWRELTMRNPMLELRVFKYDVFTVTTIVGGAVNMSMLGAMLLLPIFLQNIRGFTPLQSGLLLLPGAILMGIMSPISGILFDRIGARPLAIAGLIITTYATYEFSHLSIESTYSHIMSIYTIRMFGMSLLMMTVQTAGLNQLPLHLGSHGSAMSNTVRQIAGSIGTALLVTVMTSRATLHLGDYSNVLNENNTIMTQNIHLFGQEIAALSGLPPQAGDSTAIQYLNGLASQQSAINGINDAFIVATGITLVALFLSFFIRRIKHPKRIIEEKVSPLPEPTR